MGKVVLITGASSGIGKETALLMAKNGYIVYGAARRTERLKELEKSGIKIISLDVTLDDSMVSCVNEIIKNEGKIDILINNAGYGEYGAVEDVAMKNAKYQMEVNLFGLARLIQLIVPHMRKQHFGKIVNITSIAGKLGAPFGGWYHASKFAVEGLSDSLRLELKSFGIDVIVIEPGGVKTEWGDIAFNSLKKASENSAYKDLTEKARKMFDLTAKKGAEPIVIAKLIQKVVETRKPKARYTKGYMAKPAVLAKKWLGDALFDKILLSQMK